jgi:hypothetical protein
MGETNLDQMEREDMLNTPSAELIAALAARRRDIARNIAASARISTAQSTNELSRRAAPPSGGKWQ